MYPWEHFPECEWWGSLTMEERGQVLVITFNGTDHYRGTALASTTDADYEACMSPFARMSPVIQDSPMAVSPNSPVVTMSPDLEERASARSAPRRRMLFP